jgi:hypothetical protein
MGTRYNAESYLEAWTDKGVYPKIHDPVFNLFMTTFESESVLDLCCATGMLGTRINEKAGIQVCGVEWLEKNIRRARKYGVSIPIREMKIERETLNDFVDWIKKNEVTGIVARRCISELFGNTPTNTIDWEWAELWTNAVADAGVKEFWIEGRADQGRSVHCIPDTETEIECLSFRYTVSEVQGKTAYLVLDD